jgi:nucleoside-diphosphate-sugar epimerase
MIHVVDMARVVVDVVEKAPAKSIFNVVDDEPVSYRDLFHYVAAIMGGVDLQAGGPTILHSLGCSNKKIKSEMGWTPVYSTYRSRLFA